MTNFQLELEKILDTLERAMITEAEAQQTITTLVLEREQAAELRWRIDELKLLPLIKPERDAIKYRDNRLAELQPTNPKKGDN